MSHPYKFILLRKVFIEVYYRKIEVIFIAYFGNRIRKDRKDGLKIQEAEIRDLSVDKFHLVLGGP